MFLCLKRLKFSGSLGELWEQKALEFRQAHPMVPDQKYDMHKTFDRLDPIITIDCWVI